MISELGYFGLVRRDAGVDGGKTTGSTSTGSGSSSSPRPAGPTSAGVKPGGKVTGGKAAPIRPGAGRRPGQVIDSDAGSSKRPGKSPGARPAAPQPEALIETGYTQTDYASGNVPPGAVPPKGVGARPGRGGIKTPGGGIKQPGSDRRTVPSLCPPGLVRNEKGDCLPLPGKGPKGPTGTETDILIDRQNGTPVPDGSTVIKDTRTTPPAKEPENVQPQAAPPQQGTPGVETYTTGGKDTTYRPPTGGGGGGGGGGGSSDVAPVEPTGPVLNEQKLPVVNMEQARSKAEMAPKGDSTGSSKLLYGVAALALVGGAWWYFNKRTAR